MQYAVRSDESFNYNCLAFVVGDYNNWWEPGVAGHYWPPGFPEDFSVETVTAILALHGFVVECTDRSAIVAESVAIFADGQEWTHFAKFSNGEWCSKMGDDHDV